ncbi:hypothetical protein C7I84_23305 [Mesorhizobium ephedrae]|uniref:Uncharacterized protein n=1 Tax=Kumtagia ephedrae TaxID=2116701 RepID=A0A2P7RZD9_9HYPH|nr:hypothetical protein C7I84_23305 [Mesorhizobium ephedrae]
MLNLAVTGGRRRQHAVAIFQRRAMAIASLILAVVRTVPSGAFAPVLWLDLTGIGRRGMMIVIRCLAGRQADGAHPAQQRCCRHDEHPSLRSSGKKDRFRIRVIRRWLRIIGIWRGIGHGILIPALPD